MRRQPPSNLGRADLRDVDDEGDRLIGMPPHSSVAPVASVPAAPVSAVAHLRGKNGSSERMRTIIAFAQQARVFTRRDVEPLCADSPAFVKHSVEEMKYMGLIEYSRRVWVKYADGSQHMVNEYRWCGEDANG